MELLEGYEFLSVVTIVAYELLLFAGAFFLIGAFDDVVLDVHFLWGWLRGRLRTPRVVRADLTGRPLAGIAAVVIPAWREAEVIGATVRHALTAWPQAELRLYIGCYSNDADTLGAAVAAAGGDCRLRIVIHDRCGPTSKADCLNRVYAALREDEVRSGIRVRMVLLHDAEDMVDPAALALLDDAMEQYDFVQMPVLPEPQTQSLWVAGHYCDEFAEAHGKAMVVRDALGTGLPAAGVGCAFARDVLDRVAGRNGRGDAPFASQSLTEDYELGLKITEIGGKSKFLRVRGDDGALVATRACFPSDFHESVRQKTRWVHGIAFQGWERMGWEGGVGERWMRLRDRRGPLTALVLAAAYVFVILSLILWLGNATGLLVLPEPDPLVRVLMAINLLAFFWRLLWRCTFTWREYGPLEAMLAMPRILVSNVIAIFAGRRALSAYWRTLRGEAPFWEKTAHRLHPAMLRQAGEKA